MGTTLTVDQRREREVAVRGMLDEGKSLSQIARALGVSRQAAWEFCGRRGWLPNEDQAQFSRLLAAKDERRRMRRWSTTG